MKYLKMLGLAALAAGALMALVGVGTASATTLCENNQTTGCTKHVNGPAVGQTTGTEIDFSVDPLEGGGAGSVALKGPLGIVIATCTESTVKGDLENTGNDSGELVKAEITSLTFGNCGGRDVTANAATTGTLTIEHIAGTDNGTVRSNDTTVTIKTIPGGLGLPETCNYLTNNTHIGTLTGKVSGGAVVAPTFDINATIPTETAGCPNGTWSGNYIYTGSTPFFPSD